MTQVSYTLIELIIAIAILGWASSPAQLMQSSHAGQNAQPTNPKAYKVKRIYELTHHIEC